MTWKVEYYKSDTDRIQGVKTVKEFNDFETARGFTDAMIGNHTGAVRLIHPPEIEVIVMRPDGSVFAVETDYESAMDAYLPFLEDGYKVHVNGETMAGHDGAKLIQKAFQ